MQRLTNVPIVINLMSLSKAITMYQMQRQTIVITMMSQSKVITKYKMLQGL